MVRIITGRLQDNLMRPVYDIVCHKSNMFMFVQLQRAVAVKRAIQDVLDRSPRLQALTPPKTREVVQWCRQRGYTPPDLEPQRRNDDESIEDILTQIDSEPGELAR